MKKDKKYNINPTPEEIKFPTDQPFMVPEGYFDKLSDRIMERIQNGTVQKPPVIPIYRKPAYIYAAAIAIILIAVAGILFFSSVNNSSKGLMPSEITISDLYDNYIDQSVDEYTLQTYYARTLTENPDSSVNKNKTGTDTSINRQAIETYLLESYDPENVLNH